MQYAIVHELPGRLRVRCGSRQFTPGQGNTLESWLPLRCPGVHYAVACATNGSVLVHYKIGAREEVLNALQSIELAELPEGTASGHAVIRAADNDFHWRLAKMVAGHLLMRLLLPLPLRLPVAIWRYRRHLGAGLGALWRGKLNVPVLDAVSIGLGIATGAYTAANSIMFLLHISDVLQEHTLNKTRTALTGSLALHIDRVWLLRDGQEVSISLDEVETGDLLVVRTGGLIPVDGIVERGEAEVNEAFMTGESAPAIKRKGVSVFAGTTIDNGSLVIRVTALNAETRISRIMALIDHAEDLKARIQTKAEHLADRIVPYSLLVAALTWLWTRDINRTLSVLMVDYSCALKLSTPIAVSAAMKEAVGKGIVIKGGKYLESLAEADTLVFDKTGTLTTATPTVCRVIAMEGYTEDEVLRTAACIEEHFPHSMARAIVAEASRRQLHHDEEHAEVKFIVAHGVHTTIHGIPAVVGSAHYVFEDEKVAVDATRLEEIQQQTRGLSVIYLGIGGKLAGCICLEDEIRPEAPQVISRLQQAGFTRILMLTGDSVQAAEYVAGKLGITEYRAQVMPEDKAELVRQLKKEGRKVIMIGDGVNDSPAMSCADVAVSMKDAADLAREVSDITLLDNTLESLVNLRLLAIAAMARIRGNYRFIAGFNSGLIALGSLGILSPVMSAWLHNFSTVAVCAHSTRALLPGDREEE